MNYFLNFAKNIYTQNGEDGIIEHLFELLNITEGVVVEFGAWDGVWISNTFNLWRNKKFNAILIESNHSLFKELQKNTERCTNVEILNAYVSPIKNDVNSLDSILSRSKFDMNDYALCSIDVDSVDYQIFESIEKYLPKVLLVERASSSKIEDDYYNSNGCSLLALMKLGQRKGYTCVCDTLNAIFVRNDLMHHLPKEDYSIEKLYVPLSYIQNTLQRLDSEGNIDTAYIRHYASPSYKNKLENEKKYLRSL